MLRLMLDFVRYFLTSKNHLISSAFKFLFFFFQGASPPEPPTGAPPLDPPPQPPQHLDPIIYFMINDY